MEKIKHNSGGPSSYWSIQMFCSSLEVCKSQLCDSRFSPTEYEKVNIIDST